MILKEIWLYLSLDHFCTEESDLSDVNHPSRRAEYNFFMETKCVTSHFERLNTNRIECDFHRLIVECRKKMPDVPYVCYDGICSVYIKFDYEAYANMTIDEKKKCALQTMMRGIEKMAVYTNWDMNMFEEIAKQIVEEKFVNCWPWKKKLRRKGAKYYASIYSSVDWDAFRLIVRLHNSKGDIISSKVVHKCLPDRRIYYYVLGKALWISETQVAIYHKDKSKPIIADFSEHIS